MGTGKTAVGRALSARLGWRFEDLDARIEAREQRTIAEIFRDSGEAHFRELEHAALRDLVRQIRSGERLVAALGGGAFVQPRNAELLAGEMLTVFLDTPLDELWDRCGAPGESERPLRSEPAQFRELFATRLPYYERAQVRIHTQGKSVDQVAQEVLESLGLQNASPGKEK